MRGLDVARDGVDDPVDRRGEALGPDEAARAAPLDCFARQPERRLRDRARSARLPRGTRRRSARDRLRAPLRCDTPRRAPRSTWSSSPSIHDASPAVISAPARPSVGARAASASRNAAAYSRARDVLAADVPVEEEVAAQLQARFAAQPRRRPAPPRGACRARPGDCPPRRCRVRRLRSDRCPRCRRGSPGRAPHTGGRACSATSRASPAASRRSRAYSPIVCSIRSRSPWPSVCTSALSTSDSSSSRTFSPGSAQTASTSANVHPPAKTAMRRNRRCSDSSRSEWLQSIVARSVCCRSGMSRAPDVSTWRAWSSRSSSASGDRSRSRAAASSSASGRPSRRRQTAATASSFSGVSSNEPLVDLARSTKSAIAGGSSSGASAYSRSAAILSGVLLVVTIRSSGQRSIRPATSGAAATTCSRLSRSRSAFLSPISATMPSPSVRSSASFTSSASARAGRNCAGSVTSASATNATPSRNSGASSRPSSTTIRVFPTPPGPVIVTTRCSRAELDERRQIGGAADERRGRVGQVARQAREPLALALQRRRIRHDDAVGRHRVELERAPDVLEPEPTRGGRRRRRSGS